MLMNLNVALWILLFDLLQVPSHLLHLPIHARFEFCVGLGMATSTLFHNPCSLQRYKLLRERRDLMPRTSIPTDRCLRRTAERTNHPPYSH
jgi:hypothetical protein